MATTALGATGARRRTVLLQAAAELFAARGYHAVTTDQLGQAVGISGPAVYRHFGSKSDVLLEICNHAMDHLLVGAPAVVKASASALDALTALISFHAEFAVRSRASVAVYLREQQALPAGQLRSLKVRQREYERIWITLVQSAHGLRESDARAVTKLMLAMLNGTAYLRDGLASARVLELLNQLGRGALAGIESAGPRVDGEQSERHSR